MAFEIPEGPDVVYSHAPIVQAIMEFRLPKEREVKLDRAKRAANIFLAKGMATSQDFTAYLAQISPQEASIHGEQQGKVLFSEDNRFEVRCLTNAFAFIQNSPYRDWWYFEEHARNNWDIYSAAGFVAPNRLGVRFINSISVPVGAKFSDYLTYYPVLGQALPQGFDAVDMRVQVPVPETDYSVGIIHHFAPRGDSTANILIDIDVFVSAPSFSEEDIWSRVKVMRRIKNWFFEGIITEAVRETIR